MRRQVIYSLLTAIAAGLFSSLILVACPFFNWFSIWLGTIAVFCFAILFQLFREVLQPFVDRLFFRDRYNYQRILSKYTHALLQPMTDLKRFARIAPYLLIKSMKITSASVIVLDQESHNYILRAGEGEARTIENCVVPGDSLLAQELVVRKRELLLKEVDELAGRDPKYKELADQLRKLKAAVVIPSISESEYFKKPTLLAILCLGEKLSNKVYSREDIEFLIALANQATLGIEYAFIFEELRRHQAAIVQSEKLAAIGTTTAGIAHELKNPLTYLSTISQVLPKKWDDQKFRESVNQMFPSEVQRMQLIIEGLLNYSRSKDLLLKDLDVVEIIDKAMALLAYEIRKNNVEIETSYKHAKLAKADPNRLMQVFTNLMANAVQAMGERGGRLLIETKNDNNQIYVFFSDNGPGITEEKLKRIFDPFFTTKEGGTGLGLSITKKIVEEHQGALFVKSAVGVGTSFMVSLPLATEKLKVQEFSAI
ncbi:MAG: GHKL domain-containing protein [Candidatus Margulisbacteria bacterium]|nr:GHKL domain-containing protein [Candidatus Margulisiibacteriota bacterium]